jgi:hypothetical protein
MDMLNNEWNALQQSGWALHQEKGNGIAGYSAAPNIYQPTTRSLLYFANLPS